MYIIVGLGNPGKEYAHTRHNVGFETIDILADRMGIEVEEKKHKGLCGKGILAGQKVILLKPQTYMNLSGESVKEVMSFYKVPIENLIVVFDDISLPMSMIRLREKGSAGGHNGIKNIISHMGTDGFARVKVGIGEKPNGWDLADYVLAKFNKDEEPLIEAGIDKAAEAVEMKFIQHNDMVFIRFDDGKMRDAMNKFNKKVKEEKPEKKNKNEEENNDGNENR